MSQETPLRENNEDEVRSFSVVRGEDASLGPVFAIIIIVALLAMGALYSLKKVPLRDSLPENSLSRDSVVKNYSMQGNSDLIGEIERDLSATVIQAIDQGLTPLTKGR